MKVTDLNRLEQIVYNALVNNIFATGILPDGSDGQTDLKDAFREVLHQGIGGISTSYAFAGLCGSLSAKGLYRHITGEPGMPNKRISIDGKILLVRNDIASITVLE